MQNTGGQWAEQDAAHSSATGLLLTPPAPTRIPTSGGASPAPRVSYGRVNIGSCFWDTTLGGDAAEAEVFDFDEFVDAVFGAFAAEAGFFYAAEGGDFRGDDSGVDADDAVFEGFGDAPDAGDVAAVEIGGQAKFGVVGDGDGFGFGFETKQRRYRAEGFFTGDGNLGGDVGQDGGLEETSTEGVAVAADEDFCSFGLGVADVAFDFLDGGFVKERTVGGAGFGAGSGLERSDGGGEFGGEGIVDAVLDEDAVGADAGLAGVAILGGDGAFDGGIEVGVFKNDEGGVAAEFERKLFDRSRTLRHQDFPDLRGASERKLANDGIGSEFGADFFGGAGDDVEHAFGDASALGEFGEGQCGEGSLGGGLDDYGAAGSERGAGLAGDHGEREIPRGDAGDHADGLLDDDDAFIGLVLGNGVAVDALGFFTEPFEEGGGVGNFALGFGEGLALLEGHEAGEIVLILHHQVEPAAKYGGSFLGGLLAPGGKGAIRRFDGLPGFGAAQFRNFADNFASGWIVHVESLA